MIAVARLLIVLQLLLQGGIAGAETVRPAVWAGKFYPQNPAALRQVIADLIYKASQTQCDLPAQGRLRALILPHAGYVYSGLTAAHAHRVLAGTSFDKVILMGPDHRIGFSGAAVSDADAYATPLGRVPLHSDTRYLTRNAVAFRFIPESDRSEHCLEVVLPFLQIDLPKFKLVPIVLGTCDPRRISDLIAPLINTSTLVVVSADLSHYLPYDRAVAKDKETIRMILHLDEKPLLADDNRTCGRYPVAVLLQLARQFNWRPVLLHHTNSGDTAGDHSAVVGYAAIAFYGENNMSPTPPSLTLEQGRVLLRLARETLNKKFGRKASADQSQLQQTQLDDPALQVPIGTFVTLKIGSNLRGCIGTLVGREPLVEGVRTHALHAAFDDPRFRPLSEPELDRVTIEVSVLTTPQTLSYTDAQDLITRLRPHVDGVTLRKGFSSATFLPQVWEQLPKPEDFLSHLCLKAGLDADAWRQDRLEVETYQVQYFEESH